MSDHDEIELSLKRIEESLYILVKTQLAPIFESELRDPKLAKIYEMTGNSSANEIAKKASCSATTVSGAWKRWEQMGLLIKDGKSYRKVLS